MNANIYLFFETLNTISLAVLKKMSKKRFKVHKEYENALAAPNNKSLGTFPVKFHINIVGQQFHHSIRGGLGNPCIYPHVYEYLISVLPNSLY